MNINFNKIFNFYSILTIFFSMIFIVFFIFPLYWQITTSIKIRENATLIPPQLIPNPLDFSLYKSILFDTYFPNTVKNSFFTSTLTTISCLTFSTFASYAIARLDVIGSRKILFGVLVISMLPPVSIVGPLFILLRQAELINSRLGIVMAYTAFFLPFTMWFLSSFFKTIPKELEEAALIDGCTHFQIIYKIIIPLSAPAIFTIGVMIYIFTWNEFLFSFTFLSTPEVMTYPVGLRLFEGMWDVPWPELCAASTIVVFPIIILVLLAQRFIIQGLTAGAIKG